jgi:uncharacterized protein YigE (DUF2233 family)
MIRALALAVGFAATALGASPSCEAVSHRGQGFTICEVRPGEDDLRLFLRRADGGPHGQFGSIDAALSGEGLRLSFAMNAGMYHADRSPVGLYVENGVQAQRLITNAGPGNFGMLPNGVFCIRPGRADVIESLRFAAEAPDCTHATQSGPMLVIDGALHPRFLPDSDSRFVRNGVGTSADGTRAVFAISDRPVTFHEFGTLYRDVLGLPNALYFDGNVSRLYAPQIGRDDPGFLLGPIVGVVEAAQ